MIVFFFTFGALWGDEMNLWITERTRVGCVSPKLQSDVATESLTSPLWSLADSNNPQTSPENKKLNKLITLVLKKMFEYLNITLNCFSEVLGYHSR